MKRRLLSSFTLFAVVCISVVTVRASSVVRVTERANGRGPMPLYKPGELIVKFATATEHSRAERAIRDVGGRHARQSRFDTHYLVTLDPAQSVLEAVSQLRRLREVEYAEPNYMVRASFTPNDNLFEFQWNFRQVNAQRTWDIQRGKPEVVVAIVDSGIAYEDFGPFRKAPDWGNTVFVQGFDFVNGDSHANDDDGHGTHIASTVAEGTDNGVGVSGLAFGCALMPVKVLDNQGFGSFFDVAEGIDYATAFSDGNRGVKVINLSLGGSSASETARRAIDRAVAAGIVVVAASGNEGTATVDFPAAFSNVIAVGATDLRRRRATYSSYGSQLSVVAPGGDLDRDDDNDGDPDGILQQTMDPRTAQLLGRYDDFAFFYFDGTSSAAPHVSAVAALLVSQGITEPAAVRKAIESTAEDLGSPGRDDENGHGLVRPAEALKGLGLNQ
jgi:serine protease